MADVSPNGPGRPGPCIGGRWILMASRLIAPRYRSEVLADLVDERETMRAHGRGRISTALWMIGHLVRSAFASRLRHRLSPIGMFGISPRRRSGPGIGREWRQAARSLRKTPWYAGTIIAVTALSMALVTTAFAIVDGVLFKPLPYPNADELQIVDPPSSVASMQDVREWAATIPDIPLAAFQRVSPFQAGVIGVERPVRIYAAWIGPQFLEVLGTPPLAGGFAPADFEPTTGMIPALISHPLWLRMLGGRMDVIGRRLEVAAPKDHMSRPIAGFVVAGILRPDFLYPDDARPPDLIAPMAFTPDRLAERNEGKARALVRRPPAVSIESMKARLDARAVTQGFSPSRSGSYAVHVTPITSVLRTWDYSGFRTATWLAVVLALLACANVSVLGNAWRRQRIRDYQLRHALGASRQHLTRVVLAEVGIVVAAGSAGGILLSPLLIATVTQLIPPDMQLTKTPQLDWRVLAVSGIAALVTILAASALQLLALRRPALMHALGREETSTSRRGLGSVPGIAAQTAMTLVLLIAGTLVVASHWLVWQEDVGYRHEDVAIVEVDTGPGPLQERRRRARAFLDRVRGLTGVDAVGVLGARFMEGWRQSPGIRRPPGVPEGNEQAIPVDGDAFEILGLRAIAGRLPTAIELEHGAPVLVVSETVARTFWPDARSVGQSLVSFNGKLTFTVIGVVADARYARLDQAPVGQIYYTGALPGVVLIQSRVALLPIIRATVEETRHIGGGFAALRASTMTEAIADSIRIRTFRAWLYGAFAVAALTIATIGIVGVVAMSTAQRTREIGIRRSLGATPASVVALLLREQAIGLAGGVLLGTVLAWWSVQYVRSSLYQFTPYDLRLWAIAAAILAMAALAGALVPARRAVRIDPARALRID